MVFIIAHLHLILRSVVAVVKRKGRWGVTMAHELQLGKHRRHIVWAIKCVTASQWQLWILHQWSKKDKQIRKLSGLWLSATPWKPLFLIHIFFLFLHHGFVWLCMNQMKLWQRKSALLMPVTTRGGRSIWTLYLTSKYQYNNLNKSTKTTMLNYSSKVLVKVLYSK